MKKLSSTIATGPISKKMIEGILKTSSRKVIDISEIRDAKIQAENLERTLIAEKELAELDPLHGVYAYAQNKMSVMVEQLSGMPALSKLSDTYADAEDLYLPSGPPMSH